MNKEEILYQIVGLDSELKKGFPDEITTILKNGCTGKTYTDYDFKNHRYLYCYVSDNFNIYDRLEEKDKEIERLNKKYDKALELLQDFNMPCECVNCKIPDEYCEENCSVDCECYKKCWNKYIELELKEGK